MRVLLVVGLVTFSLASFGQQAPSAAPTKPTVICVGQFRNQTSSKLDVKRIRQSMMDALEQSDMGRAGRLKLAPIEVTNADDAQLDVQTAGCSVAIYTRIVQGEPPTVEKNMGGITYRTPEAERSQQFLGIQCTVERTDSGMPLLIDRQYNRVAVIPQPGSEKLAQEEAERILQALAKKLPTPK